LPWPEGYNTPGRDGDFLTSLRVASRPLALVTQIKIAKSGQFDLMTIRQSVAQLVEKYVNKLFGLALVEAKIIE
jgi:hypothetical protein